MSWPDGVVAVTSAAAVFDITQGNAHAARFMTITCAVRPDWQERIQAVVHVDGTARPHVVRQEDNPEYHRLLSAYKRRTGLPIVVNTSFNIHEEPIVCTPDDAIRSYLAGCVDVLAMENLIVTK